MSCKGIPDFNKLLEHIIWGKSTEEIVTTQMKVQTEPQKRLLPLSSKYTIPFLAHVVNQGVKKEKLL